MNHYQVELWVNGDEYLVALHIACEDIIRLGSDTIVADGVVIVYEGRIESVTEVGEDGRH